MESDSLSERSRKAIRFVMDFLEDNLDDRFSYHSVEHTRSVLRTSEILSNSEGIGQESLEMIRLAAAWHDCGYINDPLQHEKESCHMTRRHLPSFGFDKNQVEEICSIIMATRIPQRPEGLSQKIICDADLHYLGTDDYEKMAGMLFSELKQFGFNFSEDEWLERQIAFLTNHSYFTATAKNLFEAKKLENLQLLIKMNNQH